MTRRPAARLLFALCALPMCLSCATSPAGPEQPPDRTPPASPQAPSPQADPSPADKPPADTRLERDCEAVEAIGEARSLDALALDHDARPVRIAPPADHYGFADGGRAVLYIHPDQQTLYAVSPDGGQPRALARNVNYWFEPDPDGTVVYESGGEFFQVDVQGGEPVAAAQTTRPSDEQRRQQEELDEAGYPHSHPIPVSGRWLAGLFGPSAEESRLVALDREHGTARVASLESHRLIWLPRVVDPGGEVAYISRNPNNIWVADLASHTVRCATSSRPTPIMSFFAASADGRHIGYMRYRETERSGREVTLHVADIDAGRDTVLGTFKNAHTVVVTPAPSPAKSTDAKPRFVVGVQYPARNERAYFLVDGDNVRRLTEEIHGWSNSYVSADGSWLLYRVGNSKEQPTDQNGLHILALPNLSSPPKSASDN